MAEKYYLDSCIWIDYFENRSDKFRPLGDWALRAIKKIISEGSVIIYSDLVEEELSAKISSDEAKQIMSIVPEENLLYVEASPEQIIDATEFSKKFKIPAKDALHARIAMDNNAVLITRDKHFYDIAKKVKIKKPEDLI